MKTEEEERHVRLEKRLELNVDDSLQVLDYTRISNLQQPWMGAILYGVGVKLTRSLIWKFLWSQEGSPEQVNVQEKMLEGFLRDDFERRLQGTQNFSLSRFLWDRVHEVRKVEMRGEGAS
jgi:hypothetical protein